MNLKNNKALYWKYLFNQALDTNSMDFFKIVPKEYILKEELCEDDVESYLIDNNFLHIKYCIVVLKYKYSLYKFLKSSSMYGHLDVVKYLVENGADITARDSYALVWASFNGHLDVIKYLVENGADITAQDNIALTFASEKGCLDVVKYLESLR